MTYDFTSIMDRKGKDALAVDAIGAADGFVPGSPKEGYDVIPMWVADMNFPACPSITQAIQERLSHPSFGYFSPREEYYESILRWQRERHGLTDLKAEYIGYENGVLGGVASALRAFACPGDKILLHSPTYMGFTVTLTEAGYPIVLSPLKQDEQGVWRMDYEDMDRKLKENHIHLAIFCSPHNPCGRVWEREELEKALEVYRRNDCVVICDEIWSDIILEGHTHIPMLSLGEDARKRVIALYAPSKTFSLAGLIGSYHIICNPYLRDRMRASAAKTHYNSMNVLSMYALIGAYRPEGMAWTDELRQVITGNVEYACSHIAAHYKGISVAKPEGTYMLFLDATEWCKTHGKTLDDLLKAGWDVGVAWQDGRSFHGPCSIRMNLALPLTRVKEAFARLDAEVFGLS